MTRRLPIVATFIVLAAVATMIGLGFWQLQRLQWKEALMVRYYQAQAMSADMPFPTRSGDVDAALYRHSAVSCAKVLSRGALAGRNRTGQTGWAQTAHCAMTDGGEADVVLGWSPGPTQAAWAGSEVLGVIGPGKRGAARLVADPPLAGLEANALPDPRDIPNNHLSYAVQWFLFAATALVIYALALRKRWREQA